MLHFQPQIDLRTRRIVGAEALVRWQTPHRGLVSPAEFLPRAEKTGLILPINEWVLREACREAASWPRRGLPPLRIGVNLSSIQFQKQSVPLLVARVLAETGLDPRRLDLELTESMLLEQTEAVVRDLKQLRELGVGISIDDFGTRYSSLTYVKHFPVDRLKIDQSFVRDLGSNPHDAAIIRAIVSLGHSLELEVIAEGVEIARAGGAAAVGRMRRGAGLPVRQADAVRRIRRPRRRRASCSSAVPDHDDRRNDG